MLTGMPEETLVDLMIFVRERTGEEDPAVLARRAYAVAERILDENGEAGPEGRPAAASNEE